MSSSLASPPAAAETSAPGPAPRAESARRPWLATLLGPALGVLMALLLPASLAFEGRAVAGAAVWMAVWWMTEAVPIPVTSLLPIVLFPLFGMGTMAEVASPYANSVVFLVMGGVILGLATEKANLHLRVALLTIRAVGTKPAQIVLGLMAASALISAFVSNTATAVIMVPIAASILTLVRSLDAQAAGTKFSAAMLLGVAYGVTIGSTATLIGQPPMALMKAYLLENHDYDMQFGRWMLVGVPWAIVMLLIAWVVLTKLVFRADVDRIPGGAEMIRGELAKLGPMTTPERRIALIFATAIFFWVAVPFIAEIPAVAAVAPWLGTIDDTQVAIAAAIACFIVPARRRGEDAAQTALLQWSAAKEIPWGLLLLFGVVAGLALTELTSNTATAAAFFPIFGAVALGLGMDPIFMTIAVTLAVCSAYMLPVATPSNAVAFGSGEVSIKQMVRAGVWLNVVSIGLIMLVMYTLVPAVFG